MYSIHKLEIVISAVGTKGDIHPLIGLAVELRKRHFTVHFLSNDYFKEQIQAAGLTFHSIGTISQYDAAYGDGKLWTGDKRAMQNAILHYYLPTIEPAFDFVQKLHHAGKKVAVIGLSHLNGAKIATHCFNLPYILLTLSPYPIPTVFPPYEGVKRNYLLAFMKKSITHLLWAVMDIKLIREPHIKFINSFCDSKNVPKVKRILRPDFSKISLHIGLFPEWFGMRPKDWPTNLKLVGFPLFDSINYQARDVIDNFIEVHGSPIVFTLGTGIQECKDFFEAGLEICNALRVPGIFTGGKDAQKFLKGSSNCIHVDYVDFAYTLPKCRMIVHHGGIGTTAQAIRAGIPQIIRPVINDQPDNAMRIHYLGIGACIFPNAFEVETVSVLIKSMLENKNEIKQLSKYSEDVKRSRALVKACDLIENKLLELH